MNLCSKGIVGGMLTCPELLGNHKALLIVTAQMQLAVPFALCEHTLRASETNHES